MLRLFWFCSGTRANGILGPHEKATSKFLDGFNCRRMSVQGDHVYTLKKQVSYLAFGCEVFVGSASELRSAKACMPMFGNK